MDTDMDMDMDSPRLMLFDILIDCVQSCVELRRELLLHDCFLRHVVLVHVNGLDELNRVCCTITTFTTWVLH